MELNVLLVEDDPGDLAAYCRDFPDVFKKCSVDVTLHPIGDFSQAFRLIKSSEIRYDLILSDTYRGDLRNRDAAVLGMVNAYRGKRFCPLVVFSASAKPAELNIGAFLAWADKATPGEIETVIAAMLHTGIPQLARKLHDELDRHAGSFLWGFLEENWNALATGAAASPELVERLVRRRAALQLSEIGEQSEENAHPDSVAGLEFYIYPPIHAAGLRLGDILHNRKAPDDFRLVLTPHCHLTIQQDQGKPRAEHVLTVRMIPAAGLLGAKIGAARALEQTKREERLSEWARSKGVGRPQGRHWFLPSFLAIPHSYCDFQQLETIRYEDLIADFAPIATITPPFAEALQSAFLAYYGAVGIPGIIPGSIRTLLD